MPAATWLLAATLLADAPAEPPPFRVGVALKPLLTFSGRGLDSFGQPNLAAPTAAGNPLLGTSPDDGRLTLQLQQSRVQLWFREGTPLRAHLELDFFDASKASPTVAALPRLRIARVEGSASKDLTIVAGQDWDLHAPLNPHGVNWVGGGFLAGNSGFLRPQAKALYRAGDFEAGVAVGLAAPNATPKDGPVELALRPSGALRLTFKAEEATKVGLSAIAGSVLLDAGLPTEDERSARAFALFAHREGDAVQLRGEAYFGRNAANLGLLTLGLGYPEADLDEWGGFVSARVRTIDPLFVYGHAGTASVQNRDNARPAYASGKDGKAALTPTGPGIVQNVAATLGLELRLSPQLGLFCEGFGFHTEHVLQPEDVGAVNPQRDALGVHVAGVVNL